MVMVVNWLAPGPVIGELVLFALGWTTALTTPPRSNAWAAVAHKPKDSAEKVAMAMVYLSFMMLPFVGWTHSDDINDLKVYHPFIMVNGFLGNRLEELPKKGLLPVIMRHSQLSDARKKWLIPPVLPVARRYPVPFLPVRSAEDR